MKIKSLSIIQFIRFALVGVIATAVHYLIYLLLQKYIPINIAYTIGYVISFVLNFLLTSYFTFQSSPSFKKLLGMSGAHVINYLLQILFLNLFLWLGIPKEFAPFPVFCIVVPLNFFLLRFVFNRK